MDRTASHKLLITSANRVARKVFASLPWNVRLAAVILKLAESYGVYFGWTVYAAALFYGAEGLPDLDFKPKDGESFNSFVNRFLRNPPKRDFGAEFGRKFYGRAVKFFGSSGAEDALSSLLMQVLDTHSTLHGYFKNLSIKQIESALFQALENKFNDSKRKQKRQRTDGMPSDEEGAEIELKDIKTSPDTLPSKMVLKQLEEKLQDPEIRREVENAAKKLAPDLNTYFDLLMDGFEPRDVYNLRLLPSMQKNLPEKLRLDPTRENPFNTTNHKYRDDQGRSNKQVEKEFKEELEKYPHPMGTVTSFLNYHKALMQALRDAIGED